MRRVDEAIRQVIGDAVAGELKDPRVGFVTVTDVRTSPDLRHARVYVSVLGAGGGASEPERARGDARRPAQRPRLPAGHGSPRELRLKRTPTLEFVYDDTTDRAMRVEALIDEIDGRVSAAERPPAHARAGARADPRGRALRARHAREPRRRRARLAGRDAGAADRARQGLGDVHRARATCRCRDEYRIFPLDGLIPSRPPDIAERTVVFLDCGNIDRNSAERAARRRHLLNIDHHHDNTRFGTLNHVVPERLVHGRDRVGSDARRSAFAPTPAIAEALYVGLITDTGRFMYENTGPRAHRDGRRADRGRRRRARRLPAPVRGHAARQARRCSALALARDPALRRRRADAGRAQRRGLRARRRRGELLGGDHRPAARAARARRSRCSCASSPAASARASTKSRCAPPTTTSTCR